MMARTSKGKVERLNAFAAADLEALCEATDEAILDGSGFGWLTPPPRAKLESYWKGVLLVPERELYVARLDGNIVGTAQLQKPAHNNEAGAHVAQLTTFFVAPWARGHGLAKGLLKEIEASARRQGYKLLDLDVRASQTAAIALYEDAGFERWGVKEKYARVDGQYVAGYYYSKDLEATRKRRRINGNGKKKKADAEVTS
jgi:ribosomal protein S18 acetylase RimI-like enzyme